MSTHPEPTTPTVSAQAPIPENTDQTVPVQFSHIGEDGLLMLQGLACVAMEMRDGSLYWRSIEDCPEHAMPYTTFITISGLPVPWRHILIDERGVTSPCWWKPPVQSEEKS